MPAQLTSNAVNWLENSDTVVVTRYNKVGASWTKSVIYSGPCDLQEGSGSIVYNEGGAVVTADAKCLIDGTPGIVEDDEMVFNGNPATQTYVVIAAKSWSMWPVHQELDLKSGPLPYRGKT